jgi:hypothetical protein
MAPTMKRLALSAGALVLLALPAAAQNIDNHTQVSKTLAGQYFLSGKIDGASRVTIVAQSVQINGKIDGESIVDLTATGGGISIVRKIDGGSQVTLRAHGPIVIRGKIDDRHTIVSWCAPQLKVGGGIQGGARVVKLADCEFK